MGLAQIGYEAMTPTMQALKSQSREHFELDTAIALRFQIIADHITFFC